ncbi:permease prefix domain 1-containing protein [Deinococcus marmoris]|uniref:permease prefix domain 1-containing protein n=1 Tax=Deinococcus marmoris TaxID=249408 RepID=UPI000495EBA5|nr:permease prefix domain 1-containing protein [Deinococcus marmoris]
MKQTEQYVRQATRGLWGKARRELKTELEGHIAERCQEFRLAGLNAEEAERQTLRELGAPAQVSGGMLDVHAFPALGKAGVLSALLATAVFSALPQGLAQVQSIYGSFPNTGPASYLDFEQLKAAIEKAGGQVNGSASNASIALPGAVGGMNGLSESDWPGVSVTQNGKTYYQTDALLYSLLSSKLDVRISGWANPVVNADGAKIAIETSDWQTINWLYASTLKMSFSMPRDDLINTPYALIEPQSLTGRLNFKGAFQKAAVYALVIPKLVNWTGMDAKGKSVGGFLNLLNTTAQAQAGSVQFHVPPDFKDYKLYSNPSEFQKALEPYQQLVTAPVAQWNAQHPAPVLLLKLSGHFGPDAYTVVSPASVKKQP